MQNGVYFVSGIDTDIGKTIVTGYLAQQLLTQNIRVITQKLVQTGNVGQSDDIVTHRQMMGQTFPEDAQGLTAPQIFSYPASPHLATRLDQCELDFKLIEQATTQLASCYDIVLLEGAGGLMVPLTHQKLTIDYMAEKQYPVILVTSGRLGSINHTLLSLQALKQYQIPLAMLVFNHVHDAQDPLIAQDTQDYLQQYLKKHFPQAQWMQVDKIDLSSIGKNEV